MKKILFLLIGLLIIASCVLENENEKEEENVILPQAPSMLVLNAVSFCRIIITWDDNSNNESRFIIERSEDPGFLSFEEFQSDPDSTAYSDRQNLNSETQYYYRVKAVNSAGESDYTTIVDATTASQPSSPLGSLTADHTVINMLRLGSILVSDIQTAKSNLHIGYGHTSHGSQLTTGMSGLVAFANGSGLSGTYSSNTDLFNWNRGGTGGALDLREGDGYGNGPMDHDCGYYPNWVNETREYLDDPDNYEINVIIWSWCGQAASRSEQSMIDTYLDPMTQLENDYPDITFVYMTGHLAGSGTAGNLYARNEQIRDYCSVNNKWLFDFADIESYDPDGAVNYNALLADDECYYDIDGALPRTETNNWATAWQDSHTENTDWYDCSSAHSEAINANMKAYAAWWLWCRIAGWDGT